MQPKIPYSADPLLFISSNIVCCAFSLLFKLGIIKDVLAAKKITPHRNSHLVRASLQTLETYGVIKGSKDLYKLTKFGRDLYKNIGSIELIHDGYGLLVANYLNIAKSQINNPEDLINGRAIASASIAIGEQGVEPEVLKELKKLSIKGTICDLGCGSGAHLNSICKLAGLKGIGIELNADAVKLAKESFENDPSIQIVRGDISNINKKYDDVEVLMQYFAMHDITPTKKCKDTLKSYLKWFPNLKYFFYIDSVAYSKKKKDFLPGFDFIHGLLGIPVRTYDETIKLFKDSGYKVITEKPLKEIPSSYLWILQPLSNC